MGTTADVGKIEKEFVPVNALLPARDAFEFNWVVVAFDTGFSKSLVLSQFPKPTIVDVIPITFPVKVVLWATLTGLPTRPRNNDWALDKLIDDAFAVLKTALLNWDNASTGGCDDDIRVTITLDYF